MLNIIIYMVSTNVSHLHGIEVFRLHLVFVAAVEHVKYLKVTDSPQRRPYIHHLLLTWHGTCT